MSRTASRHSRHPRASRTRLAVAATGLATGVWGVGALSAGAAPHSTLRGPGGPAPESTPSTQPAPRSVTGVLTSTSATTPTVEPGGGTTAGPETFALSGSTIVTLGASPASPAALAVGESVTVTPAASDAASAAGVTILLVRVTGTVTAVTGDTLTVSTADGVDVTILTAASTTVTLDGSPTAPPTLAVGDLVTAEGVISPPGTATLDALDVAATDATGSTSAAGASDQGQSARGADVTVGSLGADLGPGDGHGHGHAWGLIRQWFGATAGSAASGDGPGGGD